MITFITRKHTNRDDKTAMSKCVFKNCNENFDDLTIVGRIKTLHTNGDGKQNRSYRDNFSVIILVRASMNACDVVCRRRVCRKIQNTDCDRLGQRQPDRNSLI